jgi:hypothetical protein
VHYHLRAGGVRRIIELALPHLVKGSGARRVTLAVGESRDENWIDALRRSLGKIPLEVVCEPAFRYQTELKGSGNAVRQRIRRALERIAEPPSETLFWVHNPGLARNLFLTDEIRKFAASHEAGVVFHHHDFWFENRWSRWPALRKAGFRTVDAVGESIFGAGASIGHATINRLDAAILDDRHSGAWLPNLASQQKRSSPSEGKAARRWLRDRLGDDGPVWLFPTRFLRRKNLAEAVLISRWLRPEGWLVTTAGVSSPEEANYARRLESAARRGNWRVRFRMLEHENGRAPSIPALLAASETVVMTSAQEGFGLPYLEAVAAGRPLIARRLPNVVPDLEIFGFRLPCLYDEVWIDPGLVDEKKERARQLTAWQAWRGTIPAPLRKYAERSAVLKLAKGRPFPFSRLTLDGQLEVLAQSPEETWKRCAPWNPDFSAWKSQLASGRMAISEWPSTADDFIGGAAYGKRFWQVVESGSPPSTPADCRAVHRKFIRERLGTEHLYPILFTGK